MLSLSAKFLALLSAYSALSDCIENCEISEKYPHSRGVKSSRIAVQELKESLWLAS